MNSPDESASGSRGGAIRLMKRNADAHQLPDSGPSSGAASEGLARPAPRGTAAYPRRRANKACQQCRSRRTKCDNKKPSCSFCEKIGAKCVVAPSDLSSFDPASLLILERLEDLKQSIESQKRVRTYSPERLGSIAEGVGSQEAGRCHEVSAHPRSLGFMNFENVLSWPVFENRFEAHLDIKSRLARSEAAISNRFSKSAATQLGDRDMHLDVRVIPRECPCEEPSPK
jgi:hypothetical protein